MRDLFLERLCFSFQLLEDDAVKLAQLVLAECEAEPSTDEARSYLESPIATQTGAAFPSHAAATIYDVGVREMNRVCESHPSLKD